MGGLFQRGPWVWLMLVRFPNWYKSRFLGEWPEWKVKRKSILPHSHFLGGKESHRMGDCRFPLWGLA